MPLDNLIPIGGAVGGKSANRDGPSDLTSGLISISGARDNVDVDMSDFDVGDLLEDDSDKSKPKTKDRIDDSSSKKKKKSKDKSRTSSSSSKKKSKSKSKKSAFDDDGDFDKDNDADDWAPSSKNWDSAAELELAAAAAARRKSSKPGGELDEFAKMLGLDSGDVGSGADFTSMPLSSEPVATLSKGDDDDKVGKFDADDGFGISGYKPTVRGSKKPEGGDDKNTVGLNEPEDKGNGGLSASFFQDDNRGAQEPSSVPSFLVSTTERRGGFRGSRRQTGSKEEDPFGLGSTALASTSALDSLFGGTSSRKNNLDDLFSNTAKHTQEVSEERQQGTEELIKNHQANQRREDTLKDEAPVRSTTPAGPRLSAKDDLLADLFSIESRDSGRSDHRQHVPLQRSQPVANANEKNTKIEAPPEPASVVLPVDVNPAKQHTDLLAELFITPSTAKKITSEIPIEKEEEKQLKPVAQKQPASPPPGKSEQFTRSTELSTTSSVSNTHTTSARESLLMDLLGDLVPPKPSQPLLSRRRSRNNSNSSSNTPSPEKELTRAEDPFKSSLPPSPVQQQPLPILSEVFLESTAPSTATTTRPATPPSPGRRRSLTLNTSTLAIRESEFEQSKDSLLEEILPSSPESAASPHIRSRQSSPNRRASYSQSFEAEDDLVNESAEEYSGKMVVVESPVMPEEHQVPEVSVIATSVINSAPSPLPISDELKSKPEAVSVPPPERQQVQSSKGEERREHEKVTTPICNCAERETAFTTAFEIERAALQLKIDELTQQLESQATSISQLNQQLEAQTASNNQLSHQIEARAAANVQLAQQLAAAQNDKLQADQLAATSKDDAASFQHRAELLETEVRGLREDLTRSKRAVQDAELALARKTAEHDEVDQLERHREKRALEALSAQLQRALARLAVTQQVQEEGPGYNTSPARVAAEDEARLRVIASLEGSSKRAAQHAEAERAKLAELLRELEAGARNARQGTLEDKERLRQEQQRLDALSAHLQAQTTALRDQEATHAAFMGQQLAEAREDARVYEARLATRRAQLERDERALYEARAEFAAFREQTSLEIEREYEELRTSRLALEDAWRELRADREDLETELASHEDEFQALETLRQDVQTAETRLNERSQEVVVLAETLDAGTRELLAREQLVAEQAAVVQDTDTSFSHRERALEREKSDLEAREQRLHIQIRQLDSARGRLTQQRREQQQLMAATRRHYHTAADSMPVENNKLWRHGTVTAVDFKKTHSPPPQQKPKSHAWEIEHPEEDPSGLSPALRRQVEANWQRRDQQVGRRRHGSGMQFDLHGFDPTITITSSWSTKNVDKAPPSYRISSGSNAITALKVNNNTSQQKPQQIPRKSVEQFHTPRQQELRPPSTSSNNLPQPQLSRMPPPPPKQSSSGFQPSLRVNL